MSEELYRKHRPMKFSDVVGQESAIKSLTDMGKRNVIPHALLFTGPSGTGKTTLARILRHKLKCEDIDFVEMNAADFKGIDTIRDIRSRASQAPVASPCRIWLIDEVHQLTSQAQDAFLKILEDTPKKTYFFLATTDPQKLKKTILTRCTQIACKSISAKDLSYLLAGVYEKEKKDDIPKELVDKIAECAEGSARKALVLLHAVMGLESLEDQIKAIESADIQKQSIEIARALIYGGANWSKMQEILKAVDEEPETLRRMILGYCNSILLGNNTKFMQKAAIVMEEFRDNFFDTGKAGLTLSCYNALHSRD